MNHRQKLIALFVVVSLFFLFGFTKEYHWPRIKTWILVEIENLSRHHLPVRILAQELAVDLWPPSISLGRIQALPQGSLSRTLGPMQIEKITVSTGTVDLLAGRFQIAKVRFISPVVNVIVKDIPENKEELDSVMDFDRLFAVPLQMIEVDNMQLQLRLDEKELAAQINDFDFDIELAEPQILMNLKTPKIVVKKRGQEPKVDLAVETRLALAADKLQVSALQLKKGRSFVIASGRMEGDWNRRRLDTSDLKVRSYFDLPVIRQWLLTTFPELELPTLLGELTVQGTFKKQGILKPEIEFGASAVNLAVDRFIVGHVESNGSTDMTKLQSPVTVIRNSSGLLKLSDISMELSEAHRFDSRFHMGKVNLPQLLKNIGVPNVPVELSLTADLPCQGQFQPFRLDCHGQVVGHHLQVNSGGKTSSENAIVKIDQFTADGRLNVDSQKVTYRADLTLSQASRRKPITNGKSSGVIEYAKGFDIDFESEQLHFSDIAHLVGLDFKGSTAIKGRTFGDSSHGVIQARLKPKDFYFQNFLLGSFQTSFSYEKGKVRLNRMEGLLGSSRYFGETLIDLRKERLSTSLDFEYIDAKDIKSSILRQIPLPFNIFGTGTARFKVWGPFDVRRLSYDTYLQLSKGAIGKESFENLTLDISSRDGFSKTNRIEIAKGNARLAITGQGRPDGEISGQLIARKFRIEDSEVAQSLGLKMKGSLNFNVNVEGPIHQPHARLDGVLSGMRVADASVEPSSFQIEIDESHVSGDGSIFGDAIKGTFRLPLKNDGQFHVDLSLNNWDFVPFFGIFNQAVASLNYQSIADGRVVLHADRGGFWHSSGEVTVDNFQLRRGDKELRTKVPIQVIFNQGVMHTKNFELHGVNSFVKSEVNSSSVESFDGLVSGKFDISLLAFLTPFFEDLRGPSSFSFKIGGNREQVEILGSAFLDSGYIKFHDFPHAFESIKGDFLISQSKFLINSLSSDFASGKINAHGSVTINDFKDVPTSIDVSATDLKINYPQGVKSQVSGKAKIQGQWIPLKVSGQVDVASAEVTRDFDSFRSNLKTVETNPFLPKFLLEQKVSPVTLELGVNFLNSIRVKNSLMDAAFAGALKIEGDPLSPRIAGKLNSQPNGILKVQKWPFELSEAFVQFRNMQPMDPLVYAKASGRKDEHDIQFFLQGPMSRAKDEIQLTSSPEKSKEEIVQILAFGAGETDGQAAGQVGQFIGDFLIPPDLKEKFGLGVVYQQEQLAEDAPRDRVGIKGKLGNNLDFTATRDAKESSTEVKAEYKVNKNFSVIGSWEESSDATTDGLVESETDGNDTLGLDIELKFKF